LFWVVERDLAVSDGRSVLSPKPAQDRPLGGSLWRTCGAARGPGLPLADGAARPSATTEAGVSLVRVLPAWATVAITLGAAAISLFSVLLGGWAQGRRDSERQLAEERRRTRDLGSRALVSAIAAIADSEPDGLSINTNPARFDHLEGVRDEWRTTVRPALLEFAIRTDSRDASRLAKNLATEIPKGINRSIFLVEAILRERPTDSLSGDWKPAKEKNQSLVR
jgi:hypothetical protein